MENEQTTGKDDRETSADNSRSVNSPEVNTHCESNSPVSFEESDLSSDITNSENEPVPVMDNEVNAIKENVQNEILLPAAAEIKHESYQKPEDGLVVVRLCDRRINFAQDFSVTFDINLLKIKFRSRFKSEHFPVGDVFPTSSLSLRASRTTHFCMSDNCSCPLLSTWRSDFELERAQFYERDVPEREHVDRLAIEANDILRIGEAKDPLAFLDVLLGRFVCRRFPLPCDKRSSKCVTWQSLTQAADLASSLAEAMFGAKAPNSNIMRRLSIGEAAAILRTLTATIRKLRKDDELTAFKLFSGHDVTLRPLLFALGLTHREPAHYASRLVFEVYQRRTAVINDSLFVRVLFNGVDRTGDLPFCSNLHEGLCSARQFETFVKTALFQLVSVDGLQQLCSN
uniref:Uncharacterized protein n=1 Tax=Plectus sambesii TaxID=2011161 RepID=A0A914WFU2_9BILA